MKVASWEEEWRHPAQRESRSNRRGEATRVGLWIRLECGHYPVQRVVTVKHPNDPVPEPVRVRCPECEPARRKRVRPDPSEND